MTSSKGFNPVKVSPSSTDIGKSVSTINIQSKNLLLQEINAINSTSISNIRRLKLHRDPAKCICNRAEQDNDGKYRAEIFDHDYKYLLSPEGTLAVNYLILYLIYSNYP